MGAAWRTVHLGECALKVGSGITPTGGEKVYREQGRIFIRSQNVGWGDLRLDDVAYIDEATHASFSSTEVRTGDVLLNITGASIGRCAVADERLAGGNVNQHVCIIRVEPQTVSPGFLAEYLLSTSGQQQIEAFQAGGNRQGLNFGQIRSFVVPLPPLTEQRAIATALSDVAGLIAALDQLIAKKRDLKTATMQQLLTGQRRLPGFTGAWETRELGEVFTITAGRSKTEFIKDGGRFWIVDMGSVSTTGQLTVSKATDFDGDFLRPGDLVMPKDDIGGGNIIGRTAHIDEDGKYVLGDHVYCLRARAGDPRFLSYVINTHKVNRALRSKVIGSAQLGIGRRSVATQAVPFPPVAEQREIAAVLVDFDGEIAALDARRQKTKLLKQGMMQQLLTGRTRLA